MDITAHSVTLISIIIGLGLAEMFGNLFRLIHNRRRVRWDFLPLAWVMTLFFVVLNYWWALYLRVDGSQQARTAAEFGVILAPPLLLFVATASVLHGFGPDNDWDMRRHYEGPAQGLHPDLRTLPSEHVHHSIGGRRPGMEFPDHRALHHFRTVDFDAFHEVPILGLGSRADDHGDIVCPPEYAGRPITPNRHCALSTQSSQCRR